MCKTIEKCGFSSFPHTEAVQQDRGFAYFPYYLVLQRVRVSIPLGALERALVLSPSERSDISCKYPDPGEPIEFHGITIPR